MAELQEFEKSLILTKASLLISGIDVTNVHQKRVLVKYIFYFNILWLYSDVFGEFYWLLDGVRTGKSFDELLMIIPCTAICFLGTVRTAPLYFNNSLLVSILDKLREIHPTSEYKGNEGKLENKRKDNTNKRKDNTNKIKDNTNKRKDSESKDFDQSERKTLKRATNGFYNVLYVMITANTSVIIAFCFLPLLLMALDYQKSGETELKLPFLVKYFFDPFTGTTWPFVYLHHIWSTIIVVINLFGSDTFYHAFCIYLRMHFEILCQHIEKVVTNSKMDTEKRLRNCVLRHQELIVLVEQMEQLHSKSFLFNIIMSSVLICLGGFNIAFVKQFGPVFAYSNFLLMCLYQIYMLCFFGDMVVTSSSRVSAAVFNCNWYDADAATKRSLYIILLRSQKPCSMTAAKFATMNLSAFTTILSRSWSYFALLRTMYN